MRSPRGGAVPAGIIGRQLFSQPRNAARCINIAARIRRRRDDILAWPRFKRGMTASHPAPSRGRPKPRPAFVARREFAMRVSTMIADIPATSVQASTRMA